MICILAALTAGCGGFFSRIGKHSSADAPERGEKAAERTAEPAELPEEQAEDVSMQGFMYDQLPEKMREVYRMLCTEIADRKAEFSVRAKDQDYIEQALTAVINDHPEFFWLTGAAAVSGFKGIGIWSVELEFNIPAEDIDATDEVIRQAAQEYLASIPDGASEYDMVKAAYEYIIVHTDYDPESFQDQNIQSVFLYHSSVCSGYARAFKYLLDQAGVWCQVVEGYITDTGEGHAWNIVRIDGTYTYVDPAWGDPTYGEDATDASRLDIIYDYLCITTEEIQRLRHAAEEGIILPDCTERTYDYYMLNGLFYEEWNADAVSGALWNAVSAGNSVVYLKFRDADAYAQAAAALFPENGEGLLKEPLQQKMIQDSASSILYYYSCSDELRIIKIYW